MKFDSAAVTPTGVNTCYINTLNKYQYKVLYAAKSDGTAWTDDTEMETTSMLSPTIQFYDSLSAITASGKQCVGVLVEYLPVDASYTGISPTVQDLFVNIGLTVNVNATEGALYQCTQEVLAWSRDAYEGANKSIPSLTNTKTIPTESWHWQPEYNKGYIDAKNGHLVDNTGGYQWGDAMQIVCARSRITKEVAQQENGANKSVYYMDSDQRFVDYKLNVSTEYVTYNVATTPTGVKTTLTVVDSLPKGLTYVPDSAYYGGTYVQNATSGRKGTVTGGIPLVPTITVVSEYLTLVTFEIPNVTIGEPLPSIYFTAKIGTRGVESTDVQDGESITNYALSRVGAEITSTDAYASMNAAGATIIISKNSATSRSKLADQTYIENGDAFNWTINIGNNGGTAMPNTLALDTLPYVDDKQGTAFTGTLSLTKWNVDVSSITNFNATNWKIMYTDDIKVRGTVSSQYAAADVKNGVASGPNNVVFKDITTLAGASINYTTGVVTLPTGFCPTAMVVVGTLPGNQTMKIAAQMKITNGKQGDILVNQLDGYPSPIYVVKRSIEGCTWLDTNYDGIRQDSETMLPGVTATLLKLKEGGDANDEADYEVVKDENNADVKVETGKQKDAVTGTQTNYDDGRYQFTNLKPGTYAVRFTSGTLILDNYTASDKNEGTDDTRDSDAAATYNTAKDKLEKTLILGIVMAKANDTMKDINQISRNNDSGLYLKQFTLTVSKTVATGSQTKDFTFTVYLANGTTPLTGKFDYTGSAISGVTPPQPGSITLKDGSAEITLKHGQSIIIGGIPAGTTYTVTEQAPGTGWTITAPAAGSSISGTLIGSATAAFSNSYKALNGTSTVPAMTKTLTGTLHTGFTATFSANIAAVSTTASGLTVGTMPMPPKATVYTPAFITTGTQSFASFGSITYSVAGKYVYRITENTSSVAGVTCDKSEYTLTVDVTDVNGQLTATQTITQIRNAAGVAITDPTTVTAPINFANSYAPKSTAVVVVTPSKQLSVTEGNTLPENYSEKFTASIEAITKDAPMPANTSVDTDAFTATGNKNFTSFGSITFTAIGTYEYTIKESIPTTVTPGMTYDKSEYKLSVLVKDENGQLKATPTYIRVKNATGETANQSVQSILFENRYAPATATLASGTIIVRKSLEGHVLPTAKVFSFTLTHNPTTQGPAAGVSMTEPTTIKTSAITQGTNVSTTKNFGTITFNRVGTYTFTVAEEANGINNMNYADSQTVIVKVTDTAGILSAVIVKSTTDDTPTSGALTFTNTYQPKKVVAVNPPVEKKVSGTYTPDTDETFTFLLTPVRYIAPDGWTNSMSTTEMPISANQEITITGSGTKTFGSYTYTMAGTYVYTITEKAGNNKDYDYDDSIYTYQDEVVDKNGELICTRTMTKTGITPNPTVAVFDNTYTRPMGTLVVSKTVTGGGNPDALFTFRFTFSETTRYDYIMSNGTVGTIATGESLQLKDSESVSISIHEKVTYKVEEDAYMSYIPTPDTRTFTGTISDTESRADYINQFDLPFIPPTPTKTGNLTIQKTVTGDLGDRNKDFTFTVKFDATGSYYYTGSKTGMISSGDTVLLRHGESITVINLPEGTKYTVTESDNSGYRVNASDDTGVIVSNQVAVTTFVNDRRSVPNTGDDASVLRELMLMLFSFGGMAMLLSMNQGKTCKKRKEKIAR